MAKTILIPIDFSVKSLTTAKIALESNQDEQGGVKLILIHGISHSTSISELLFYSKHKTLSQLETPEFEASCRILRSRFENILESMVIDLFSGTNQAAFENYLKANHVDEAYMPVNQTLNFKNRNSFDLSKYLLKSNLSVQKIDWRRLFPSETSETADELSSLFFLQGLTAH
jgi:hypothetical protein